MKKYLFHLLSTAIALILICPLIAFAETEEVNKVLDAIEVLHDINRIPEQSIPPILLSNAYGIAVVPGLIKVGFVFGGRHGRGVLSVREENGKWSNPTFITLTGGSVGWQIGAQSTDIILVFKSRKSIDAITAGKFTLGADAGVAAGPVGRQAGAGTDVMLESEIYSYSRSRGLFAGVSIEGAALQIDDAANAFFYGKPDITPVQILQDAGLQTPAVAEDFKKVMNRYATR